MSEEDVRVGLRDAVADEPPLDFDPDSLVAQARHQAKRRRSLMAAGAATVAVVVAAVAIPVVLGRGSTQVAQQPTSTPSEWSQSSAQPVVYSADALRNRSQQMAVHLDQAVPAALPEASNIKIGEFGGEASGEFYEGQKAVNAAMAFSVDDARYSIVVTVWVPGSANELRDTMCSGGDDNCKPLGEEDGGQLVGTTENLTDQGTISTVYHFRKDESVVQIAAYNYDMTGVPKYMPTIPVTVPQLTTLATDPELGL